MEAARGFFDRRQSTGITPVPLTVSLYDYVNVSPIIGAVVSSKLATLHELQTVYGAEDAYDLLEIATVDSHNQRLLNTRPPTS